VALIFGSSVLELNKGVGTVSTTVSSTLTTVASCGFRTQSMLSISYSSGRVYVDRGSQAMPGIHKVRVMSSNGNLNFDYGEFFVRILPPGLPPMTGTFRAVVVNSANGYVSFGDGYGDCDIKLDSVPSFTANQNGPSRAVVRIRNTLMGGTSATTQGDVRSPNFNRWSAGGPMAISEGQLLILQYYDQDLGSVQVFCDTIKKIGNDDWNVVELEAYDCLLGLSTYKDRYIAKSGYSTNSNTFRVPTTSPAGYDYIMPSAVSELTAITMTDWQRTSNVLGMIQYKMTGVGKVGMTVVAGGPMAVSISTRARAGNYVRASLWTWDANLGMPGVEISSASVYNSSDIQQEMEVPIRGTLTTGETYFISVDADSEGYYCLTTLTAGVTQRYFYNGVWNVGLVNPISFTVLLNLTTASTRDIPITTGVLVSGSTINISESVIGDTTDGLLGMTIQASYFTGSRTYWSIIKELLNRAGLMLSADTGQITREVTTYDTGTSDYLTCIAEMIGSVTPNGYSLGISALPDAPGEVFVGPRCVIGQIFQWNFPTLEFSTNPYSSDESSKVVASHALTANFKTYPSRVMAISEDDSGNPMMMCSDDNRWKADSVQARTGYTSIDIITDQSLNAFPLLASAVESKIREGHVNRTEGDLALWGFRTRAWSFGGDTAGGKVVNVWAPQYRIDSAVAGAVQVMEIRGRQTVLALDCVRSDNRNLLVPTIDRSTVSQTTTLNALPSCVYISARSGYSSMFADLNSESDVDEVRLLRVGSVTPIATVTARDKLAYIEDGCGPRSADGYKHVLALFDVPADMPYASNNPLYACALTLTSGSGTYIYLDSNQYAYAGQKVLLDIRISKN
jgi:hypothetical protein